jgi:hypothetical protein
VEWLDLRVGMELSNTFHTAHKHTWYNSSNFDYKIRDMLFEQLFMTFFWITILIIDINTKIKATEREIKNITSIKIKKNSGKRCKKNSCTNIISYKINNNDWLTLLMCIPLCTTLKILS